MPLTLYSEASAVEPLTLDLVKQQIKLPVGEAHPEDQLISDVLIPAVRQRCEQATGRQLRVVTYDWTLDSLPSGTFLEVPRPPLLSIVHFKHLDSGGTLQTLVANTDYIVSVPSVEKAPRGRIALAYGKSWPSTYGQMGDVTIRFTAGYGSTAGPRVPAILVAAMLMDAATLYADRENLVKGGSVAEIPGGRRSIYWAWKSHSTQMLEGVA